jgi:membrane protease YdiL (CAAX protease family)
LDPYEHNSNFTPLPLPPLPPVFDPTQPILLEYQTIRSNPLRVWTVFVAFAVALVAGLIAGGVVPLIMVAAQASGQLESGEDLRAALVASIQKPAVLLTSGAVTQAMLLLTAICAAILSPLPLLRRLRLSPSSLSSLGYLIAPIGAMAVSFLFGGLVALLGIHESGTLKLLGDSFKKLSPLEVIAAVLIVGVAPGFAEEFLFRGYAQTRLVQRWGRWIGITITAVLFGIMHMDPLQGTFAVGFGFYVGYLAEKSGSIRPGMACHAVNNSVQVILGRYFVGSDEQTPKATAAWIAAIALSVLVAAVIYIRFRAGPSSEGNSGFPIVLPAEPETVPPIVEPTAT